MNFKLPDDQADALRALKADLLNLQNQFIGAVRLIVIQNHLEGQWSPSEDCSTLIPQGPQPLQIRRDDEPQYARLVTGSAHGDMAGAANG